MTYDTPTRSAISLALNRLSCALNPIIRPLSVGYPRFRPIHYLIRLAILTYLTTILSAAPYSPPVTHRADLSLDSGWRFIRQDVAGAQTNGFDDSNWSLLNLP